MKDLDLNYVAEIGLTDALVPEREGDCTSNDCRIDFATFGAGRPAHLFYGGMGNARNWANRIEDLVEAGRRVVLMDTRGPGRSTQGNQGFSERLFAQDVGVLIQHLALTGAISVGWSDGACTALEFAGAAPGR